MRFNFNRRKAAQAAAYLAKLHGGQINMMALIKLLYLADRMSLLEVGAPITGDRMVSMPHGPVLSQIYDSAKWGGGGQDDPWCDYLSERQTNDLTLLHDPPDVDELSDFEIEILERIHTLYGSRTQWQLRDLTHRLPEWQDPSGSSLPIDPETILRSAGKSDEEIQRIAAEAEEDYFLGGILSARRSAVSGR